VTIATISHPPINQIEAIAVLKNESLPPASSLFSIQRSLPHGQVAAVFGTIAGSD
jgi:hypothetical protein